MSYRSLHFLILENILLSFLLLRCWFYTIWSKYIDLSHYSVLTSFSLHPLQLLQMKVLELSVLAFFSFFLFRLIASFILLFSFCLWGPFFYILLCLLCYNCHFHSNPYKQTAIPKILIFTDLNSLQHVLKWIDYALPTSRVRTKHHNNEGNRQVSRLGQGGNYSRTQHKKQKIT